MSRSLLNAGERRLGCPVVYATSFVVSMALRSRARTNATVLTTVGASCRRSAVVPGTLAAANTPLIVTANYGAWALSGENRRKVATSNWLVSKFSADRTVESRPHGRVAEYVTTRLTEPLAMGVSSIRTVTRSHAPGQSVW